MFEKIPPPDECGFGADMPYLAWIRRSKFFSTGLVLIGNSGRMWCHQTSRVKWYVIVTSEYLCEMTRLGVAPEHLLEMSRCECMAWISFLHCTIQIFSNTQFTCRSDVKLSTVCRIVRDYGLLNLPATDSKNYIIIIIISISNYGLL